MISSANGRSSKERTENEAILQHLSLQQEILFLQEVIQYTVANYKEEVDQSLILNSVLAIVKPGMSAEELLQALIFSTTGFIEIDPAYSRVCGDMLRYLIFTKVTGSRPLDGVKTDVLYRQAFVRGIYEGAQHGLLDKRVLSFDLEYLAAALCPERDALFDYMGLRQLYDRYFLKNGDNHYFELPQTFWMRVAMGTALLEENKNEIAVLFYTVMSTLRYVPSTPTLLHAAKQHPQLSSCYLTTVADDLHHIFKAYSDNAQMAKWSGGVANDWSYIRACGSKVASINTESQGLIPFLKIVDVATASINRSGKRRGACCVYLENWHLEIEDFLDLKKNTGDERRRTHDINTAVWIPDLFMKRIQEKGNWTLFSPHEVPGLHDLYGATFEQKYKEYELMALAGKITMFKLVAAEELWRKILSRLFETGHPWVCFKDPSNIRSPQDHVGVIHSSNLCTEILLNTSFAETAVCNIGSINYAKHIHDKKIDKTLLAETISTAMRMLDNIIDINYYPTKEGEYSNLRHRPVGLGVMGFQDMLYMLNISFSSLQARDLADEMGEFVAYHAILSSSRLARERGMYQTYKGSKWDRNILPQDTIDLLEKERGQKILLSRKEKMDWHLVREHIQKYGMRNSTTMAIAPTATIANISGVFPSIEPIYKNLYVKANMSGEFTIINKYLVQELKQLNLWTQDMRDRLKYYDGSIQMMTEIPENIREKYQEAFELDPLFLVEIAAARGRWIDQSQSYNIFMKGVSGKLLHEIYFKSWQCGLKTTYYLRTLGASQIEKSTLDAKTFGFTQNRSYDVTKDVGLLNGVDKYGITTCNIEDPLSCESCQ